MAVLAFFGDGFAGDLDGLPGADVQAAETGGAGGADGSVVEVVDGDVRYGAGRYAEAAADAEVGVDLGFEASEEFAFDGRDAREPACQAGGAEVVGAAAGTDVVHDALQTGGVFLQFPQLVVGVAAEEGGAVVGHADFVAVGHADALATEDAPHRPDGVAGLGAAGDDDEEVGRGANLKLGHEVAHGGRGVEVVARVDEADGGFGGEVGAGGFGQGEEAVASGGGDVSGYGKAVAGAGEVEEHVSVKCLAVIIVRGRWRNRSGVRWARR